MKRLSNTIYGLFNTPNFGGTVSNAPRPSQHGEKNTYNKQLKKPRMKVSKYYTQIRMGFMVHMIYRIKD
jgi:hypothetical protein